MDIQPQLDLKAYADRLEVLCRAQADEINRLRELARATEGAGALATLQSLYRDPALPESLRAKCAIGCLVHETPALKPVQQLELTAEEPPEPLADRIARQRARMDRLLALPLEERSEMFSPSRSSSGNGSGDDSDDSSE